MYLFMFILHLHRTVLTMFLFCVRGFATGFIQALGRYTAEVTEVSPVIIICINNLLTVYMCLIILGLSHSSKGLLDFHCAQLPVILGQ